MMTQTNGLCKVPSAEPFSPTTTVFEFNWPKGITPLERIILSASGDLQRMLSAFFTRPITIKLVFSHVSPPDRLPSSASPSTPIVQKRQVHLLCDGRTVCTATSTVTITSPECARLFLEERYAIGQLFRAVGTVPKFSLLKVSTTASTELYDHAMEEDERGRTPPTTLWRRYILEIEGIACDIVEVFPDREMFVRAEEWLDKQPVYSVPQWSSQANNIQLLNVLEVPVQS